jgi:hypothetical protein
MATSESFAEARSGEPRTLTALLLEGIALRRLSNEDATELAKTRALDAAGQSFVGYSIALHTSEKRMNPRHAAALALLGWYLMVPPLMTPCPSKHPPKHPPPLNFWGDAPLSRWDTVRSFNRAGDCEKELKATIQRTTDPKFTRRLTGALSMKRSIRDAWIRRWRQFSGVT